MSVLGGCARAVALLSMLLIPLAPIRSEAGPPGPPEISFQAERLAFTLSYDITVEASDPDGAIRSLSLCVDGACSSTKRAPNTASDLLACISGDAAALSMRHTFDGPGTFGATVEVKGGGCPVLGADETVIEQHQIDVPKPPPPHEPIECSQPGEPSATDVGVHEDRVVLGGVVTQSGGASFKGDPSIGLRSAVRVINASGGVCDRLIDLRLVDDGGDEQRRAGFVRSMIASGEFFAFVSVPARGIIDDLEQAGMPDVGTLGETVDEFASHVVWPVGPGNHAFGWIAVDEAYALGARTFGVVYDSTQPFGNETGEAVEAAVAAHDGATMSASAGILPAQASYSAEIEPFNTACDSACDAVIIALEPQTALTWLAGRPRQASVRTSLHPTLFDDRFAANCGLPCRGQVVWTGFQPAIGDAPGAERACADIRGVSPAHDCSNPSMLAAYEAVFVAARAMGHVGVDLTRTGLASALDTQPFDIGLHGGALSWESSRQANQWMRGYDIVIAQGSFAGWRDLTGWREDPR